jgi:hypothetical protein
MENSTSLPKLSKGSLLKKGLRDYSDAEIQQFPVKDEIVYVSGKINDCVPGKLCKPGVYFEMIEECEYCGKLI